MLPRWILMLALTCGMLLAPFAMAAARAQPPAAEPAASHCAEMADTEQHAPSKPLRCIGACSAIEVGVVRLAARTDVILPVPALPRLASPHGILLERDTPPPRPS